ncbi:sigma-54 dependent transcriptional regulator [Jeongeupia chitinilytica]|uniref:Sigma-54-dependent Fis family transcriptional regulator n=1 Tax=Jeongeupia chitinilytica TaxID=1041641 RepID=A0ABQ3H266_9NEIS|nr:sigma-54 dependent transcriptional regulator [Jeongeupia chitinilytica]GHD66497.1 sigma-54-dependent Fis family transcriptional regulator [Jeongeupia chitinilytica]
MNSRALLLYSSEPERTSPAPLPDLIPGWQWSIATTPACAHQQIHNHNVRVGVIHLPPSLPVAFDQLETLTASHPQIEWIVAASPDVLSETDVGRFIASTCFDYHTLPADPDRLAVTLGHAWGRAQMRERCRDTSRPGQFGMVGESAPMLRLYGNLEKISNSDAPVLVQGESGTGKELVARAIHRHSSRAQQPYIAVNCGAIPVNLIQSELFGYEKGAFTGANQRKIGLIESANGGTVFLDEIGDLPFESQVMLLRFLQEHCIERVGGHTPINVDVRVIAATHVNLELAVAARSFREDLFYRLNVLRVTVPPLRERLEDVDLLADWCFEVFASEKNAHVQGFSLRAKQAMSRYGWPGNVRELINRVRRAMVMSESRLITAEDLLLDAPSSDTPASASLEEARDQVERDLIEHALQINKQNITETARQLGLSRSTLYRLINKLELKQ